MSYFDIAEARKVARSAVATDLPTSHTHTQSDVTRLVSDLSGKASSVHTHAQADVTSLVSDLAAKAASVHTHPQSDVTGLTTALAAKEATANKDVVSGYAGLNAASRVTKGVDTTDHIVIDLATSGLVLKDTQGTPHYWRVSISILGLLVTTDLGTVKP